MYETLDILGLQVYSYGFLLTLAALAALALMGALAHRRGLPAGTAAVFGALAVPFGLIFARAAFCLVNVEYFASLPSGLIAILSFFDGGLSIYGAIIGLALAAAVTAKITRTRFYDITDALCAPFALFAAAARAAERFTDLGIGKIVEAEGIAEAMPWLFIAERAGKNIEYRMAVYRYEAAFALILFAVMLALYIIGRMGSGDMTLCFIAAFGASQIIMESLRDDGHMLIIFLRAGQLFAVAMPIIAAGAFLRRRSLALGKNGRRNALAWALIAVCVILLVLLEFSLDGRLTVGSGSALRDYIIMLAVCAALCALPLSLRKGAARSGEN